MKKSVISLMLTLSLLLGTVLGCFSLPVAAENAEGEVPVIVGYDAALVGTELQVAVNATNASTYKLYEDGNAVIETANPILTKQGYDSQKTYYLAVVSAGGIESAKVAIDPAKISTPDAEPYNPSNLFLGKQPTFTAESLGYANSVASVKDPMWMFDGDINTRYSTVARSTANKAPIIDFTVDLGGTFSLGELKIYDYDGTRRCMGMHLVVEAYINGSWTVIADLDKDEIAANYVGSGQKKGHLFLDLAGYKAEMIRFINEELPVNNTDAISFWEISLSGIMLDTFATSSITNSLIGVDAGNVLSGKTFYTAPESNFNWTSGEPSGTTADSRVDFINSKLPMFTDGNTSTASDSVVKVNGSKVMYDVDLDANTVIDSITVMYGKNTGNSAAGGQNRHYNTGSDVVIYAYYNGTWNEVYREVFTENTSVKTFPLGVAAEKIRYYCTNTATPYTMYDADGNAAGESIENSIGIAEITAVGRIVENMGTMVANNSILHGKQFVPTPEAEKAIWPGNPYSNLTNGEPEKDRFATTGANFADATLTFDGVAVLENLIVCYESAARCGSGIVIEVFCNGKVTRVVDEVYSAGVTAKTFNLGGVLAQSIRLYIPGKLSSGDCISIREIYCSGFVDSTVIAENHNNILSNVEPTVGPAATAVNAANYGYSTLTDGGKVWTKVDGVEVGRFSTFTISNSSQVVAMDASFKVDKSLNLNELRIYDFNPANNIFAGDEIQIMLLINGVWKTVYDISGVENIYAPHRVDTYLSFDLSGANATEIRIVAKQHTVNKSLSLFEIELSASKLGTEEYYAAKEVAEKSINKNGNILLGIPSENLSVNCSVNVNHPLYLAFDGIIEPDVVNGAASKNRYAANGNKITDANGNQIGSTYTLTIDLKNNTALDVLSIYEWRSGGTQHRSNDTTVEVRINNTWVVMCDGIALNNTASGRTDFDLGGVVANGIRITFVNNHYEGAANVGWWPPATIKEITCTSVANLGDVAEAFDNLCSATPSDEFGASELHQAKINEALAGLGTIGTDPAVLAAKIEKINASAEKVASGVTPVTDAYGDFKQANISLAGNVGFNFYGALDENVEAQFPNASVVVRYNTVLEGVVTTNTEVIKLGELAKDKNGRYIVDFDMAAAQMTDDVEIRLVLDGDNCGEHITWSVKDYCDVILAGDYDQKLKDVVTAMLNYGAYAQSYFGYKTDDLAADLSDLGSVTETAKPVVAGSVTGVNLNRWTLTLDSNVTMKLYFTLDGVNPEDLTVTVTGPDGSVTTVDALELVGSRYRVTINDITSGYLNDNYVVTVTAGGENLTVTSSAMCYVSGVLAMENADPALVNLVTALKLYSVAADAYFGK